MRNILVTKAIVELTSKVVDKVRWVDHPHHLILVSCLCRQIGVDLALEERRIVLSMALEKLIGSTAVSGASSQLLLMAQSYHLCQTN